MGTTGGLLEVLERCVGFEGISDGFAALVADLVAFQAVKAGELVSNSKGRPQGDYNSLKDLGTTGGLLEVLERCVGLEGISNGFAALDADLVLIQAVKTGESVSNRIAITSISFWNPWQHIN